MKYCISLPQHIHELGKRANQEDFLIPSGDQLSENNRLFILCDGMGGHESGEVASCTVCETMYRWVEQHSVSGELITMDAFNQALSAAYDALDEKDNSASEKKMGTTMTFLMLTDEGALVAHIGDSRIYQFRHGIQKPVFKTRDHSLVNDLVTLGEITEEEAKTNPNRNVITRAIQPHQERRAKADIAVLTDVRPDDWFYMCSDGMLEKMDDDELAALITDPTRTEEEKKSELIARTSDNKDNHTAFLIHVTDVEGGAPMSDGEKDEGPVAVIVGIDESSSVSELDESVGGNEKPAERETNADSVVAANARQEPSKQVTVRMPSSAQVREKPHQSKGHFLFLIGLLALLALLIWLLLAPSTRAEKEKPAGLREPRRVTEERLPDKPARQPVSPVSHLTSGGDVDPGRVVTSGDDTPVNAVPDMPEVQQALEQHSPMVIVSTSSNSGDEEVEGEASYESDPSPSLRTDSGHTSTPCTVRIGGTLTCLAGKKLP